MNALIKYIIAVSIALTTKLATFQKPVETFTFLSTVIQTVTDTIPVKTLVHTTKHNTYCATQSKKTKFAQEEHQDILTWHTSTKNQ